MPDDKSQRGGPDRGRVSAEEPYEASYFAMKHGISIEQAKKIISEAGPSREKADAAAEKARRS
jgi:hypothetical protein